MKQIKFQDSITKSLKKSSANELRASVAGVVERINKLITVRAAKMRYNGEVGDIIVGRVVEVQQKLWKVDCGTRLHANLNLAAVIILFENFNFFEKSMFFCRYFF